MYVVFYKSSSQEEPDEDDIYDDSKYKEETGSGDMMKVLATVVEAVRRTAEVIGGMDKVHKIHIEPADERRFNIYMHYVETLFKDFSVKRVGNWMSMVNRNYNQLKEIGTATSKGVPELTDIGAGSYEFTTDSGNRYEVEIYRKVKRVDGQPTYNMVLDVSFYVLDSRDVPQATKLVNDPKNLYKVMAAVIKALKKEAVKQQKAGYTIDSVRFYAAKQDASDNRRKNLYKQYVKKLAPEGSEVIEDSSEYITINLPDGYRFKIEEPKDTETK
jgi:hypothetical protein